MSLKWEHKKYEKNYETKEIYIKEIKKIIKKVEEDYEVIKRKSDNTEIQYMNSQKIDKVLDNTEKIKDKYYKILNNLEDYIGEIR